MKVWISKYALTKGLYKVEVERCTNIDPNMISVIGGRNSEYYYGEGREWHLTKEEAIKRAEELKQKEIDSLKKQVAKLEKMDFSE